MDILDNKIDQNIVSQISIISFNYIDFDDNLSKSFNRIKNKFPNTMVLNKLNQLIESNDNLFTLLFLEFSIHMLQHQIAQSNR